MLSTTQAIRKIIHVDMDCFYAAIEIRDNPALANKPVAVGGGANQRGVICTCNYIARQYGIRSAMSTFQAYQYCKDLILLPVNMSKYKQVAQHIQSIFKEFTDLVEPLSLDEAYLDVTGSNYYAGSATRIAQAIRERIWQKEKLTASAGVASNKFLAKIASGWRKPNGLFVIQPHQISDFVNQLSINELHGVGKVTAEKLHRLGLKTCADLQKIPLSDLANQFGKLGHYLYQQCHGLDNRSVEPNRIRKSLSVERTFSQNIIDIDECINILTELYNKLKQRIEESALNRVIKSQFIKIKYSNFQLTTAETSVVTLNLANYLSLFNTTYVRNSKPIRLLGIGVHFHEPEKIKGYIQQKLFIDSE
jgi:DNA polymerase-4